jgi:hypothetical protein
MPLTLLELTSKSSLLVQLVLANSLPHSLGAVKGVVLNVAALTLTSITDKKINPKIKNIKIKNFFTYFYICSPYIYLFPYHYSISSL